MAKISNKKALEYARKELFNNIDKFINEFYGMGIKDAQNFLKKERVLIASALMEKDKVTDESIEAIFDELTLIGYDKKFNPQKKNKMLQQLDKQLAIKQVYVNGLEKTLKENAMQITNMQTNLKMYEPKIESYNWTISSKDEFDLIAYSKDVQFFLSFKKISPAKKTIHTSTKEKKKQKIKRIKTIVETEKKLEQNINLSCTTQNQK